MIIAPLGYAAAIQPGNMVIQVLGEVRLTGTPVDGPDYFGLPFSPGGVLTVDNNQPYRRSLSCPVVDDDNRFRDTIGRLTPKPDGTGWLSPYGASIRVQFGVSIPGYAGFFGDNIWYLSVGTVRISNNDDEGDGEMAVVGYDYAKQVSKNPFTVPYIIPSGTLYTDAIPAMVSTRLPPNLRVDFQVSSSDLTTPQIVIDPDQDPWAEAEAMAEAIGYVVYFDRNGIGNLNPRVDVTQAVPVRSYVVGVDPLVAVSRSLSDDPGYNGVSMRADSSVLPAALTSTVWDENPDSPTYHLGPYGEVPYRTSSPYIATQAQGDAAAAATLTSIMGLSEQLVIAALPDPTLEASDVVYVRRNRQGLPTIDGNYVIDSITLPLSPYDPMTLRCHRQRAVVIPS